MDRVDKLIMRAKPKLTPVQLLTIDNPYIGKSFEELLDMLCPETPGGYQAPQIRTPEWNKFMYAMLDSEKQNN